MGNIEEIIIKAEYCLNCKLKPCTKGCPLGNNIPDFIKSIKEEKYEDAYNILCKTTVLPSICGRICPHENQCQGNCVRGINGKPVSIGELESFIGDMAIEKGWKIEDIEDGDGKLSGRKIAIVGSGPAGLTCAAFLAKNGYKVTIFEKYKKIGGLLRHGIPEFRLNKDILDKQIKQILDLEIDVEYGKALGIDFSLEDLQKKYDAVFLAFGANISKKMDIPGEDLKGVFGGNELLENNSHPDYKEKKVAVIGGGNVAMDCARTIKRLGADKVYVVYRRAEEQMPATRKEITDAKSEKIEFLFQNNVTRIIENSGNKEKDIDSCVTGVECVKTELIKMNDSERLVPVDIDGSNYILNIDYVVMAIGSEAEINILNKLGVKLNKWGFIDIDENSMTSIPNVFAGGDLTGTNATVAWAARSGRDAAEAICRLI